MPAQIWPASLPQAPLVDGFQGQVENNLSAFKPALGQALVWPRGGDAGDVFSWSFLMSKAQLQTFLTFYRVTLKFGAYHIILPNYVTDEASQEYQIDPSTTPQYVALSTELFRVTLQVYRVPATAMSGT